MSADNFYYNTIYFSAQEIYDH